MKTLEFVNPGMRGFRKSGNLNSGSVTMVTWSVDPPAEPKGAFRHGVPFPPDRCRKQINSQNHTSGDDSAIPISQTNHQNKCWQCNNCKTTDKLYLTFLPIATLRLGFSHGRKVSCIKGAPESDEILQ